MKGKRLRSLSGTVLIMVLTVMLVLIIMLMATLTVVTTASQRIYTKYEENQAYYTARSALDVFTSSMLSDAAYYAYKDGGTAVRDYLYTDVSVTPSVDKTVPNAMKQGTALQLDLYKIRSQNDDGIDLKFAENPVDTDKVFVLDIGKENNNKNYSLNSSDTYTKDGSTYTGLEYIEYDVMLPMVDDGSNKYGKMVDTDFNDEDGDGDKKDQIARIRVEVLDRKLATEPSYTTQQIKDYIGGDPSPIADDTAFKAAIAKGSRSKDYMKIKITSTVKMMDVEGVAVVVFETTEKDPPAGDNAITTTGGYTGGGGAQFGAAGGAATMDSGTSVIADGNTVSGKLFSVGSFEWKSSSKTDFGKGDKVVAMGDITIENAPKIYSNDPGMFFYSGGTFTAKGKIGEADSKDVSIICNTFVPFQNEFDVKGNIFCETFKTAQNGKVSGKVYTNDVKIDSNNLSANIDSETGGLISLSLSNMSNCSVVMSTGGTIYYEYYNWKLGGMESGSISASDAATLFTNLDGLDVTGSAIDISTYEKVEKDGKIYRKINLPYELATDCSDKFIELPTAQAMFADYCMSDAFDMETGDLKLQPGETDPYSPTNKSTHIKTGTKMLAEFIDDETIDISTVTMDDIAEKMEAEILPGGQNQSHEITSGSDTKYYKFDTSGGTNYEGTTWTVTGNSGRIVIIIPDNKAVTLKKCRFITDNINPQQNGIGATIPDSNKFKNGTTKAPKIDIYGGDQSQLIIEQKGFIPGYIIMPTGFMSADGGLVQKAEYNDGKGLATEMGDVAVVGSILCGEFKESNKTGVMYLDKDSGASTPGEPALSVQASHYSRN